MRKTILFFIIVGAMVCMSVFRSRPPRPGLPSLARLQGSAGVQSAPGSEASGQRWFRVQTHLHGPFSYDSCDDKGLNPDGTVNTSCEHDLKEALCTNHVDFAFLTDHPGHLNRATRQTVLLLEPGDTPVLNSRGEPVATRIACKDGTASILMPGLEGTLLALGTGWKSDAGWKLVMEKGGSAGRDAKEIFERETGALVGAPHLENRELSYLEALGPDFVEVFNLHAAAHPVIRRENLGEPALDPWLLRYFLDPFGWSNPDFFVLEFLKLHPLYFEKWDRLLARFHRMTAVLGLDSHQNALKMKVEDGFRMDSHRRLLGAFSNWVKSASLDPDSMKSAIRAGRVLMVFEILGTPEGFDFFVRQNRLEFRMPHVLREPDRVQGSAAPLIRADLIHVDRTGKESRVLTGQTGDFSHPAVAPGHYRVEVFITPLHLLEEARSSRVVRREYPWILTNAIEVVDGARIDHSLDRDR